MRTRLLAVAAFAVLVGSSVRSSAQSPVVLSADDGAQIMRMILTMEMNRPFGPGRYGALTDVLNLMPEVQSVARRVNNETATIHGYTIRLNPSADGQRFDLTLAREGSCDLAWFSNDRSVIYSGRPLGCPAQ